MGMEAGPRSDAKHGTNPGQPTELEDSGNDDDAAVTGNADLVMLWQPGIQPGGGLCLCFCSAVSSSKLLHLHINTA